MLHVLNYQRHLLEVAVFFESYTHTVKGLDQLTLTVIAIVLFFLLAVTFLDKVFSMDFS